MESSYYNYLLSDEGHDTDPGEDVLPGETLPWHSVRKVLAVLVAGLAQVTHEQGRVRLEALLRLATQVSERKRVRLGGNIY